MHLSCEEEKSGNFYGFPKFGTRHDTEKKLTSKTALFNQKM